MNLDRIAGQRRPIGFLRAVLEDQTRLNHAYLFVGPARVGKTATALAFAADLLAAAGEEPRPGRLHPDLWVEDSEAENLSIDVVRREGRAGARDDSGEARPGVPAQPLQAFLSLKGLRSDRRVAVLARAERLTEHAEATLLKTLEEPPAGAVLILCAEAAELLPPTIQSRCQEVEFTRLTAEEMREFAERQGVELSPEVLELAHGSPGDALRLAADPEAARRRAGWAPALAPVRGGTWLEIVALGARFGTPDSARNRGLAREALDSWEWSLRGLAAARAGALDPPAAGDARAWDDLDLDAILDLWESAREAADRVESNVNPRLAIEVFLADVAEAGSATRLGPTRRVVSRSILGPALSGR